jgi:acetyl esterase/lipase
VDLKLDFYRAQNANAAGAPCVVVVHGGGWDGGERGQLPAWNHRWAARGYAVAAVSYRLAPRFIWPAQRDDVLAAIAWLKTHARELGVDATRLVLLGRSAGGQIATAVAYGARDPAIRGVVSFYAPQDMEFAWGVSREDDALNSVNLMRQYLGGPPDTADRKQLYATASAQAMIGPATPPTLLLHGVPDTLVWHRHSERLTAALQAAGVRHFFVSLPWATHAFDFNPDGPGGQLADFAIDRFLVAMVD